MHQSIKEALSFPVFPTLKMVWALNCLKGTRVWSRPVILATPTPVYDFPCPPLQPTSEWPTETQIPILQDFKKVRSAKGYAMMIIEDWKTAFDNAVFEQYMEPPSNNPGVQEPLYTVCNFPEWTCKLSLVEDMLTSSSSRRWDHRNRNHGGDGSGNRNQ